MPTVDYTFVREGRPLADWLPQLVADERAARLAAAEALGGMWRALPRYSTDFGTMEFDPAAPPDLVGQAERFKVGVREAVERPDFPKALFARRLMLFRLSLKQDWLKRVEKSTMHDEDIDKLQDRLLEQSLTHADPAERERAAKRFGRVFGAAMARDNKLYNAAESMQASGMMAHVVFGALDTALLAAPDVLREMLGDDQLRSDAADALARMGPAAREFVPLLLERMDGLGAEDYHFFGTKALSSIGRDDPAVAATLLERLKADNAGARHAALGTVEQIGPHLAGREEEAVSVLRGLLASEGISAVPALASVGRDREDVMAEVLEWARPKPPRMRSPPDFPQYQYDEVMGERGVAIEALRYFTAFPEQLVPVLTDAIDSFQEYDPDWSYERAEHGRVVASLRAFGAAAAPAAAVLVRHLRQSDGDPDWEVIRLLGDIGPRAAAALPALEALNAELMDGEAESESATPPDRQSDALKWAIWRIGGST
jgi:hypothetical protein